VKKIVTLCLLLLVLVPATVGAAGAHWQGKSGAGTSLPALGERADENATASEQNRFCPMYGQGRYDQCRYSDMNAVASCRGIGDQVRTMARNQTCNQDGIGDQVRTIARNQTRNQDGIGDQVRTMARNQTRLRGGACANCPIRV